MSKIEIIISWDGIMKESQFSTACSDTIRHGIISDEKVEWKGIICSPFKDTPELIEKERWNHVSYENSEYSFGWINAINSCSSDWILLAYPGVAIHIDKFLNTIENIADPNDAVCYCAASNYDVDSEVCEIIKSQGARIDNINEIISHEWGSILLSKAAVQRIIKQKDSLAPLSSRSGSPIRFDHIMTIPRTIAKVPLVSLKSMSPNRVTEKFSGINRMGTCSLMHYVGDWMDDHGWYDYLRARLFASSLDGLLDGQFGSDLSMPEIKSDVVLLLSEPGNIDRIKWLQKSCQQHVRPVPSIVVMLQESKNGRYYGRDYEKVVDFCASTRTGIIRMRQDSEWNEQALLLRGCRYLIHKNAKRIFASVGDCCLLNDPFKYIDNKKGILYFNDDGIPGTHAFGVSSSAEEIDLACEQFELWNDHTIMRQNTKIKSYYMENFKVMRRESLYWKGITRESFFKLAKETHVVAAVGESACRSLISNT